MSSREGLVEISCGRSDSNCNTGATIGSPNRIPTSGPAAAAGILCVVVAVSFTLLSGVATSLGTAGVLSPWLAGWAPAILYAAIAAFFGWRLPGSGRTS